MCVVYVLATSPVVQLNGFCAAINTTGTITVKVSEKEPSSVLFK